MLRKILIIMSLFLSSHVWAEPNNHQLLLVLTKDWKAVKGHLQRYEHDNSTNKWMAVGKPIPIVVGKNGLAWPNKKEGDLRTPVGIYSIPFTFGFAKSNTFPPIKLPYVSLDNASVCVDDNHSKYYNKIVNTSVIKKSDWNSAENMKQVYQYKWGAFIEYNNKQLSNAGSCIFMHIWRDAESGTAGCVAMSENNLKHVLYWLDAKKKPAIAIMTEDMLIQFRKEWKLLN